MTSSSCNYDSLATVSRTAESPNASRLWRLSGMIRKSPECPPTTSSLLRVVCAYARSGLCLARIPVLAQASAGDHADHGPAQYLLMTASPSLRIH